MTGMKTNERPGTRAQVRYLRMSASKARVVLNLIRDKHIGDALQILQLSERLAAKEITKVLNSAVANAEHNDDIPAEELYISACYADEGPTLKRFRPRARGRAGRIHKQTCHITLIVSRLGENELDRMRQKAAASGSADASASRRARVAKSKQKSDDAQETPLVEDTTDESSNDVVDTEVAESSAPDAGAEETTETELASAQGEESEEREVADLDSTTQDSDSDGEANATDESPYGPGSHALIDGDPDLMPEGFPIKGNDDSKLYHNEDSSFYRRTKAEVWFASDEAAEAAGFSKPPSQLKKESDDSGDEA